MAHAPAKKILRLGKMFRGQFTRLPDMCLSAKTPCYSQQLKEYELHFDGG